MADRGTESEPIPMGTAAVSNAENFPCIFAGIILY